MCSVACWAAFARGTGVSGSRGLTDVHAFVSNPFEFVYREMRWVVVDLLCVRRAEPDAIRHVPPFFGWLQRVIARTAWRRCFDMRSNAHDNDFAIITKCRPRGNGADSLDSSRRGRHRPASVISFLSKTRRALLTVEPSSLFPSHTWNEVDKPFTAVVAADDQRRPLFQPDRELPQEPKIFNFYMLDTHLALLPIPCLRSQSNSARHRNRRGVWLTFTTKREDPLFVRHRYQPAVQHDNSYRLRLHCFCFRSHVLVAA